MTDHDALAFARPVVAKAASSIGPVERAEIAPGRGYVSEKF